MDERFDLTVQVDAGAWAYAQRRLSFLETLLVRVLREHFEVQEWFTASEFEVLRLPGLPTHRSTITRKARQEGWECRWAQGRYLFHVSALPSRAFDALLTRILDLPPVEAEAGAWFDLPSPPAPEPPMPVNTAPQWVLPLMRLMRNETDGDLARAWRELPHHVPEGTALPTVQEAAQVLVRFGLA